MPFRPDTSYHDAPGEFFDAPVDGIPHPVPDALRAHAGRIEPRLGEVSLDVVGDLVADAFQQTCLPGDEQGIDAIGLEVGSHDADAVDGILLVVQAAMGIDDDPAIFPAPGQPLFDVVGRVIGAGGAD